jgi:hypothetical protein
MINRRSFLMSTALLGAGALAGCTTSQIAALQQQWANVAGSIQSTVANVARYIPTIESIAQVAASIAGPGYATVVTAASALFNQIVAALTAVVGAAAPPPLALRRMALAPRSIPSHLRALMATTTPVLIGTTSTGVNVAGWH